MNHCTESFDKATCIRLLMQKVHLTVAYLVFDKLWYILMTSQGFNTRRYNMMGMDQVEVVLGLCIRIRQRHSVFAVIFGTCTAEELTCTFRLDRTIRVDICRRATEAC